MTTTNKMNQQNEKKSSIQSNFIIYTLIACEYGPAAAGALSVAINSCALTVVEIFCCCFICFLAADSTHKLRAVMDDDWYACMISCAENEWRRGHVCCFRFGCSNVSHVWWEHDKIKERITTPPRDERDNKKPKQTNINKLRVFLPSRGRQSVMILIIRFSFTHTHTHTDWKRLKERRVFEIIIRRNKVTVSSKNFLRREKNEKRKATNNTNEY